MTHFCNFIKVLVGNCIIKVAPFPSSDWTRTVPLYISALCFTIDKPSPVPLDFVEKYGSKILLICDLSIPGPLSLIRTTID